MSQKKWLVLTNVETKETHMHQFAMIDTKSAEHEFSVQFKERGDKNWQVFCIDGCGRVYESNTMKVGPRAW